MVIPRTGSDSAIDREQTSLAGIESEKRVDELLPTTKTN